MFQHFKQLRKPVFTCLIIIGIVFTLDISTKEIIRENVSRYESIEVIPEFMNIVHVKNRGGIFGILRNIQIASKFLTFVSFLVLLLLFYLISTSFNKRFELINLSFITGGAFGNVLERLIRGYVTDFIDIYVGKYHWPAFNLADVFITLGISLLVLKTLLPAKSTPEL